MAERFSEKEKKIIDSRLRKAGVEMFQHYGIRKTTVEELASKAGIAKGSFYLFYPSKVEFFFTLFEERERELKEGIAKKLRDAENPKQIFREFIYFGFNLIETDPLMGIVFNHNEMSYLMRKLPEERFKSHMEKDTGFIRELFEEYKKSGLLLIDDIDLCIEAIVSLFYLIEHRGQMKKGYYSKVKGIIVEALIDRIFKDV